MDAFHCAETSKTAMDSGGKPEIFNSDQGCHFTCSEFVVELRIHGIQISMDERGRCLDTGRNTEPMPRPVVPLTQYKIKLSCFNIESYKISCVNLQVYI